MIALTPAERRALRAKAHQLHPVVSVGQHGLTPAVLHEIDVNLKAHELIKVRVFDGGRDARETLLERICVELDAAPVQHIGKLLIVWRPAPEPRAATPRKARGAKPRERRVAAKKAPQVRRPRTPLPRAPARPPAAPGGGARRPPMPGGRRRRPHP